MPQAERYSLAFLYRLGRKNAAQRQDIRCYFPARVWVIHCAVRKARRKQCRGKLSLAPARLAVVIPDSQFSSVGRHSSFNGGFRIADGAFIKFVMRPLSQKGIRPSLIQIR